MKFSDEVSVVQGKDMAASLYLWLNIQFPKSQYPLHLVSYLDYNLTIRPFSATYSRHIVKPSGLPQS